MWIFRNFLRKKMRKWGCSRYFFFPLFLGCLDLDLLIPKFGNWWEGNLGGIPGFQVDLGNFQGGNSLKISFKSWFFPFPGIAGSWKFWNSQIFFCGVKGVFNSIPMTPKKFQKKSKKFEEKIPENSPKSPEKFPKKFQKNPKGEKKNPPNIPENFQKSSPKIKLKNPQNSLKNSRKKNPWKILENSLQISEKFPLKIQKNYSKIPKNPRQNSPQNPEKKSLKIPGKSQIPSPHPL